jgi:endonuclease/exonuclease/phosphatase family metal-dependent hydrolase
VINAQTPDVLGVQEVGDPDALADLVALLEGDWHQRVSAHPDGRGIRVACLSRHPITGHTDVVAFPPPLEPVQTSDQAATEKTMGRGALAVTVAPGPGEPVQFLTSHLKSKLLTFPGGRFNTNDENERARFGAYALYRRTAEATTVRVWATGALANAGDTRRVVVSGDLNDTPEAATTQLLHGPPGSEIGTGGFGTPDQGDNQRLWNLAPLMPEGKNYSRINHGRKELIDHLLVSAAIVKHVVAVEAVIPEPLPSVTTDPTERADDPSSDHAPVVATFDL